MYVRTVGADTLTFGVSGDLWNDALVMYDRETDSRWASVIGKAIVGQLKGQVLTVYPATHTTWRAWQAAYPRTRVLKKPLLSASVYAAYNADSTRLGIHGRQVVKSALPAKSKVIGFSLAGQAYALPLPALIAGRLYHLQVAGRQLIVNVDLSGEGVAVWRLVGTADSPLELLSDELQLARTAAGAVVSLTSGMTTDGRPVLERIISIKAYWFGWHNFYPETEIIRP